MFDPGAECPECGGRLLKDGSCRYCNWKPEPEPVKAERPNYGIYREFPERIRPERIELTPEIKAILDGLRAKLGRQLNPGHSAQPLLGRCSACETGTLVHQGMRFCLACYAAL